MHNAPDCSQFYTVLYFDDLGPDPYIKPFLNVTFKDIGDGWCIIKWHEITNITEHLKTEYQEELLLMKLLVDSTLYSRITFRIYGPLEDTMF
jgi:hypothetical protein